MPAYLLLWNPESRYWPEAALQASRVRDGLPVSIQWITGLIHSDTPRLNASMEAHVDGKRVIIEGAEEVVLKCVN